MLCLTSIALSPDTPSSYFFHSHFSLASTPSPHLYLLRFLGSFVPFTLLDVVDSTIHSFWFCACGCNLGIHFINTSLGLHVRSLRRYVTSLGHYSPITTLT